MSVLVAPLLRNRTGQCNMMWAVTVAGELRSLRFVQAIDSVLMIPIHMEY